MSCFRGEGGCSATCNERGPFFFFFFSFALFLFSYLFSRMDKERDYDAGGEEAEWKKEEASIRLLRACKQKGGDVEAARQAIEDGANVDVRDEGIEWSPLMYAADPKYGNNLEIVQMLIDAGCDVNQVDWTGNTALNVVIVLEDGDVRIVEALLRGGANPNIANKWGNTPCHFANTIEVLELVLDAGGDPRKKNNLGETPFQYLQRMDGNVVHLRPIYEAWTPHRVLPRWTPSAFPLYIEGSSVFGDAIITLLMCLRRHRRMIPKEVGMEIVEYVAEMHRREMWWPSWQDFDMEPYMSRFMYSWE